jgi:hypothetical protein
VYFWTSIIVIIYQNHQCMDQYPSCVNYSWKTRDCWQSRHWTL